MDHQDRELILGLANRLRQAPPVPQDPQAAELIAQEIAAQPNSVYLLVQAVLVQEDELRQAQARIAAMAQQSPGQTPNPAFTTQAGHTSSPTFTPNPAFTTQPGYALQPGHGHHRYRPLRLRNATDRWRHAGGQGQPGGPVNVSRVAREGQLSLGHGGCTRGRRHG